MLDRAAWHLVGVAKRLLCLDQVVDVHQRRKGLAAAAAARRLAVFAHLLVKPHADLGRALEDVEEFPKGQPQEGDDNRHGVEYGDKLVGIAAQPCVAGGEHQSTYADGKK